MKQLLRFLTVTFVAAGIVGTAYADWTADGSPISTADDLQMNPVIISDGGSGTLIAWQDRRNGTDFDIYVQKLDASGNALWTPDGVAVCTEAADQTDPRIASDGAGGVIVVWEDARTTTNFDIYVQRVDTDGNALWTANGVEACILDLNQHNPVIVSDDAGGAIVVWQDHRIGQPDIYAQRFNDMGDTLWTAGGIPVCAASRPQQIPVAVSDDHGGVIASWVDRRAGLGDIYVQRLDSDGSAQWTTNGVALCTDIEDQGAPAIVVDQLGGAFVAWADKRSGGWDIYANQVDALGVPLPTANGIAVCTAAGDQTNPAIAHNGFVLSGGDAIVAWEDTRDGNSDIYARLFENGGNTAWAADGVPLCTAPLDQVKPVVAYDGVDGVVVAWQDQRPNFHTDIYAQRVDANGNFLWDVNGMKVCGSVGGQYDPVIASGDAGSAIVAWEDMRSGTYDVYAQRTLGAPTAVAILSFDATSSVGGVALQAAFRSDLTVEGVHVYRGNARGSLARIADVAASGAGFEFFDRDVAPGETYRYQIGVVDADGEFFSPIVVVTVAALTVGLDQNRPNPFNPSTTIHFVVPAREHVSLVVFDASGRKVRTLVDEDGVVGPRDTVWDGRDDRGVAQSSGVYFYRLQIGKHVESRKMVLLK